MVYDRISVADIDTLMSGATAKDRAVTAMKIASQYAKGDFTRAERILAEEIFRLMLQDAAVIVRKALAETLADTPDLPKALVQAMADDVDAAVAAPVLKMSDVLAEEDLLAIADSAGMEKLKAVAGRHEVSEELSQTLSLRGDVPVLAALLGNAGARIGEAAYENILVRHGRERDVQAPMIDRKDLPVTVAERLVSIVALDLRNRLLEKHPIGADKLDAILVQIHERAQIDLARDRSEEQVAELAYHLYRQKRLTPSLVLRALCLGNLMFFEHSVALIVTRPVKAIRTVLAAGGRNGISRLCEAANFPPRYIDAIEMALKAMDGCQMDGRSRDMRLYSRRMVERMATLADQDNSPFADEDLEELVVRLDDLPSLAMSA